MHHVNLTKSSLEVAKTTLKQNLDLKSGHLTEAMARALGASSHAALLADLKTNPFAKKYTIDSELFIRRLEDLGSLVDPDHASFALIHAFHPYTAPEAVVHDPKRIRWTTDELAAAASSLRRNAPWTLPFMAYGNVPDPTVKTIRIDRDIWRWHPVFLGSLSREEIEFVMMHAGLSRKLGYGARRGNRDQLDWDVSCELVVNDALHELRIGTPLKGINWDGRFGKAMSVEDVYDQIVGKRFRPSSTLRQGSWKSRGEKWPASPADICPASRSGFDGTSLFGDLVDIEAVQSRRDIPAIVTAAAEEIIAAIKACKHIGGQHRGIPSAMAPLYATKTAGESVVIPSTAVPKLIVRHPWLIKRGIRGATIEETVRQTLLGLVLQEVEEAVNEQIAASWQSSVDVATAAVAEARLWLSSKYPEARNRAQHPFPTEASVLSAKTMFRGALFTHEMIVMASSDDYGSLRSLDSPPRTLKADAKIHVDRLREIELGCEAVFTWYEGLERVNADGNFVEASFFQ